MPCGQIRMFPCILCKCLNESNALCLVHWQVVVFWLPWAQQEAAGWWTSPLAIPELHLQDYMPSPTSSNFQIMRQQKTMALAKLLQACTKESGFPTGVLCDVMWELQWCMAPLLVLKSDEIVEASLLRPIEGECGTSPMPKYQSNWRSVNRYSLQSEPPLLQPLSQPLLLNQVPYFPRRQRNPRKGQPEWVQSMLPSGSGLT